MPRHSRPTHATPAIGRSGSFTLLLVACLTIMVGCVITPGLPSIAPALGVPHAAAWLVTLPSLGVVLFGAPAGRLIGTLGAYRALCAGLVLYAVLGACGVLLRGPVPVFADRILLGGATALVMASGTLLIAEFHHGAARLAMMARQGMAIELGGVIFLSIGGALTRLNWAAPFALYLVAIVILVCVTKFVPKHASVAAEHDGFESGHGASAPVGARLGPVYAAAFTSMLCFFTSVIVLPFMLTAGVGDLTFDEAAVGYFLSFVSLVAVCMAAAMPRIVRRFGPPRTLVAAYALALGLLAIASSGVTLFAGAMLLGTGFGLSVPLVNHMTVERSRNAQRGQHLAYLSVAIFSGQFAASCVEWVTGDTPAVAFGTAAGMAGVAALAWGARCLRRDRATA